MGLTSITVPLLEAQLKGMLCNLALSVHESPANRKFQELNLSHTLDLFPLVSSEKMEIGVIITGSPPHPMDFAFMGCGEDNEMYRWTM